MFIIQQFDRDSGTWHDLDLMRWETIIVAREALQMLQQIQPGDYFRIVAETKEGRIVL